MAVESLTLTPPTGSPIDLNGSKWSLQELDLGMPPRREELVTSVDSHGGVPARVSMRDTREVTATLRLMDATSKDNALSSIASLEAILESAEGLAAEGPTDPVAGLVRLVYSPANSTQTFSLLVLTGEIEVPKTNSGDEQGWFIGYPVVKLKCQCDPFAYGALRTYLDTTTSASIAPSVTVAGGPGDVPPWTRLAIKDVAATSRGRVLVGVKRGESSTTATILASAMTAIAGTYSAPNLTLNSATWAVMGQTARQTRTGNFRIYAHRASGFAQIRLAWAEAGGSLRRSDPISLGEGGASLLRDVFLGEVSAGSAWDIWIEGLGAPSFHALIIEPADSHIEVTQASPGEQLVGATVASDALQTTSTHIGGRSLTVGGTWTSTASSPTWPVSSSNWARRTAVNDAAFAQAGTANYMDVEVSAVTRANTAFPAGTFGMGVLARYVDSTHYLALGIASESSGLYGFPVLFISDGSFGGLLWRGSGEGLVANGVNTQTWRLQVMSDGRWAVSFEGDGVTSQSAHGVHPSLISGGSVGNPSNAKVGLFDNHVNSYASTRDYKDFRVRSLTGVTPAPVPSGSTLCLAGPRMYNTDLAEYLYIGSSGITLTPGVNNNLTVIAQRSAAGHASTSTADTPALDLDIDGYPRFLSVPHT